jgi:hypothetical protein
MTFGSNLVLVEGRMAGEASRLRSNVINGVKEMPARLTS